MCDIEHGYEREPIEQVVRLRVAWVLAATFLVTFAATYAAFTIYG